MRIQRHIPNFFSPEATVEKGKIKLENINNTLTFSDPISQGLYWGFFTLVMVTCILIYIFRRIIYENYQNRLKIMGMKKSVFWMIFGIISLVAIILRSWMVILTNYPNKWESLPLHFCRLMLVFIALCATFGKLGWIKFYGPLAITGAILAIIVPGVYKTIGPDNFWFYDYILAHGYILITVPLYYAFVRTKYTFQDTIVTIIFFFLLCLLIWTINLLTITFSGDEMWKSNYFYLGKDDYNEMYKLLGPIVKWPYNLFVFTLLGILVLTIWIILWCWLDKYHIEKVDGKIKAFTTKSEVWRIYKASFKTCFKKPRSNNDNTPEASVDDVAQVD